MRFILRRSMIPRNLEGLSEARSIPAAIFSRNIPRRQKVDWDHSSTGGKFFASSADGGLRYSSRKLRQMIDAWTVAEHYDAIVCDFLFSAENLTDLGQCVLFQHDVVTTIWQRHVEQNSNPLKKLFFKMQLAKIKAYEGKICRAVKHVIAVSEIDASKSSVCMESNRSPAFRRASMWNTLRRAAEIFPYRTWFSAGRWILSPTWMRSSFPFRGVSPDS